MKFIDRAPELRALEKRWRSPGFDLLVIYGRRRIGKTELIKEFSRDKPHIYLLSSQDAKDRQLDKMLDAVSSFFHERKPDIHDWRDGVGYLKEKLEEEKILLTMDEFPRLVQSNRSILSYLQELADEIESESTMILCGSSIGVMESEVMGHKSPLFGRRTGQIDLQPFDFSTSLQAIKYPFEEAIRSYAVTGGAPMYLLSFDYGRSLEDNIRDVILDKTSFMFQEPEFLLRTELRNPSRYMSVLEAVANGHTKPNRISNHTGIDRGPLSAYLKTLRRLRLLRREIPVTEERKKSKRSLYEIDDNFLRFWFHYVEPRRSSIEISAEDVASSEIMASLDEFSSKTFEDVCRELISKLNPKGLFSTKYSRVGRWWHGEHEIDIIALNESENEILLGECKWSEKVNPEALYFRLKEKKDEVRWRNEERNERYVIFAKSFNKVFRTDDLTCMDLEEMETSLK